MYHATHGWGGCSPFSGHGGHGPAAWFWAHGGGCGPRGDSGGSGDGGNFGGGDGGGWGFGVRRPLRFMAHKLELDDKQVATLAKILDDLKTERAQAEVDRRRTVAAFADALAGPEFNHARVKEAGDLRVQSAERLRGAVLSALEQVHAMLDNGQREGLAYLIRSGVLTI